MTIINQVPNVQIEAPALRLLDTDGNRQVTVQELNAGLQQDRVVFSARGSIIPNARPIVLFAACPPPAEPPREATIDPVKDLAGDALRRYGRHFHPSNRDGLFQTLTMITQISQPGSAVNHLAHTARRNAGRVWNSDEVIFGMRIALERIVHSPDIAFVPNRTQP